ncbi:MAG: hypothetical protein FWC82_02795 [Firmicutes bacterium]|nr:hypothetical protein [Bacillota bacterium]
MDNFNNTPSQNPFGSPQNNQPMRGGDEKAKNDAAGFAIGIGILSIIGAFVLPLILRHDFSNLLVLIPAIITAVIGLAFVVAGVLFWKMGGLVLAIILLILFVLYAIERILIIILGFAFGAPNIAAFVWLAASGVAMFQVVRYLRS